MEPEADLLETQVVAAVAAVEYASGNQASTHSWSNPAPAAEHDLRLTTLDFLPHTQLCHIVVRHAYTCIPSQQHSQAQQAYPVA